NILESGSTASDFDGGNRLVPCKFDRVSQKVLEDLSDEPLVAVRLRQWIRLEYNMTIRSDGAFLFLKGAFGYLHHIDVAEGYLFPPKPRQSEQPVDQFPHFFGIVPDDIQQPAAFVVQRGGVLFDENARESVNSPQRRAHVVRDGVREAFKL